MSSSVSDSSASNDDTSIDLNIRQRLIDFYKVHNPQKLNDDNVLDAILSRYKGRESKLFEALNTKYITTKANGSYNTQQQQSSHNNYYGQTQSQVYANKQAQTQEQVKTRVLMEQLDAVIDTLDGILDMVQNRALYGDTKINLMTDMLIKSCNYFARNCYSYKQQNYQKALKLAQKKIYDHWDSLDGVTYNDTISYRNFLMKAIQSKKLEQMNKRRTKTKNEQGIKNRASKDPKEINAAWSKIIYHKAKYDQQIEDYEANPAEKEQDYDRQLAEFNKNKKYHKNIRSRQQPIDESSMYFTQSGQSANFTLKKSLNAGTDQKLDEELMGCLGGDNNKKLYSFMNAVIYASPNNKLMDIIDCEMPCLLLEEPPKCGDARKVHIHLPNPYFNHKGYYIPVDEFVISRNEQIVEKVENDYMANMSIKDLGYKSIGNQRNVVYNAFFGVYEDVNMYP